MTQPTVSKHWRKLLRIRLQYHQVHPTMLQWYKTYAVWQDNTHKKTQTLTQMNLATVYRPSETKPNPENCKNCSSKCAYDCAQLQYTIQHRTVLKRQNILSTNGPTLLRIIHWTFGRSAGQTCSFVASVRWWHSVPRQLPTWRYWLIAYSLVWLCKRHHLMVHVSSSATECK